MALTKIKRSGETPEIRNKFYNLVGCFFGPDTKKFFIHAYEDEDIERIKRDCEGFLTELLGPKKAEIEIQKILSEDIK